MSAWIITRTTDNSQWGTEKYSSKEEAARELKTFWKGTKVDFSKFEIVLESERKPVVGRRSAGAA